MSVSFTMLQPQQQPVFHSRTFNHGVVGNYMWTRLSNATGDPNRDREIGVGSWNVGGDFTAGASGIYQINVYLQWDFIASPGNRTLRINVNGNGAGNYVETTAFPNRTDLNTTHSANTFVALMAGGTVSFDVSQNELFVVNTIVTVQIMRSAPL